MLSLLTNLTKATVALAATPITVVADVLTLPASSYNPHRGPFDKTAALVSASAKAFKAAVKPNV